MKKIYEYDFVKKEFEKAGLILLDKSDKYKNIGTNMLCVNRDGYYGFLSYSSIKRGLTFKPFSIRNKFGMQNLKLYLENRHFSCVPLFNDLPSSKELVKFECQCGNVFYSTLDAVLNSNRYSCNSCSAKRVSDGCRTKLEDVKLFLFTKGYKILQDFYLNENIPIEVEDDSGYRGFIRYNSFKGLNRPLNKFSLNINKKYFIYNLNIYCDKNDLKTRAIEIFDRKDITNTLIKFVCNCGNVFYTTKDRFISVGKQRCNFCTKRISSYENKIIKYLAENKIEYTYQKRYCDCRNIIPLPFDFYLTDYDILLEIDGEGHFKPIRHGGESKEDAIKNFEYLKNNEKIKDNYCIKNNIKLIRIPYYDFKNLKYIETLKNNLLE